MHMSSSSWPLRVIGLTVDILRGDYIPFSSASGGLEYVDYSALIVRSRFWYVRSVRKKKRVVKNIIEVRHSLIDHSLTVIRQRGTTTEEFRKHAGIVAKILLIEATKGLGVKNCDIETPLAVATGKQIKEEVIVVPVLRAGLAMLFALQDFLPAASVGFIGLERDEKTAQAREYYRKLPKISSAHLVIVIDPPCYPLVVLLTTHLPL